MPTAAVSPPKLPGLKGLTGYGKTATEVQPPRRFPNQPSVSCMGGSISTDMNGGDPSSTSLTWHPAQIVEDLAAQSEATAGERAGGWFVRMRDAGAVRGKLEKFIAEGPEQTQVRGALKTLWRSIPGNVPLHQGGQHLET